MAFAVGLLASLAGAGPAQALVSDPWTNPSFNTGNLNAWQSSGQVVPDAGGNPQSPASAVQLYAKNFRTPDPGRVFGYKPPTWLDNTVGSHYALVLSGCEGTQDLDPPGTSTLSRTFEVAHAGDVLSGYSFFKSNDYYNDGGTVQILDADGDVVRVLFHSDQATVGTYQGTPWVAWSHTFEEPGTYTLQVRATSGTDCEAPSAVGLDLPTPNPLKMGQTISHPPLAKTYGDANFDVGATATSGHPVSYSSTTPSVCTIVDGQVHIVGAGTCSLTASVAGDQDYAPKTQTIALEIAKAPLSINAHDKTKQFGGADPGLTYGLTGFVNAETQASAGVTGTAVCSSDPDAGPDAGAYPAAIGCEPGTLSAANYGFQAGSKGELTITKADQAIDLPAPGVHTVLDPDFDLGATASSGLPVDYASSTPDVCTVVGGQVHLVGAGDCTVTASQAGNGNYNAAPDVTRTFAVAKVAQAIDFPAPEDMTFGDSDADLDASASSGLPVSYASSSPSVCTVAGGQVSIVGAGQCTVTASQAGNGAYQAAQDVSRSFTVAKADQSITLASPGTKDATSGDFDLGATASSGLPVSYASSTPDVCTIVDGQVHLVGAGLCTVTASQGGNGNHNAAPDAEITFEVAKASQTIDFGPLSDKRTVDPDFDPAATASSGLQVEYSSSTPDVCEVVDGKVDILAAGTCTITASQAGNGIYAAAPGVTRSFSVTRPTEPPSVAVTTPEDGASYYQYESVEAEYACEAAQGVDIASCVGDAAVGSPIDTSAPGPHSFKVTATDTAGNQATKTVSYNVIEVRTLKGGGAFVIGDRNAQVGNRITFWGSKWSKENSLSGGGAPSSFKGFADSASANPLAWGGWWTTRTGNSSKPPDSVPSYMAVIVASTVDQSKSTIAGDNPETVVVKTEPGYGSNPGHPGTGTVVAKLG